MKSNCEECVYFMYDEEYNEYYCSVSLDEDEAERMLSGSADYCKYFGTYDEYKIVRKQN